MSLLPIVDNKVDDILLVTLSREIAMNVFKLEDILERHNVDEKTWDFIQSHPRFTQLLQNAVVEWESALNTEERVKVKSATMIELWLTHASALLHSQDEDTGKKTELAKFIARLANMGVPNTQVNGGGERLSVIINLGSDQLKIEKDITPRVIEHDSSEA